MNERNEGGVSRREKMRTWIKRVVKVIAVI